MKLFFIECIMKSLVGGNPWYILKETASAMSFTNSICFFLWLWRNDAKRTRIFGWHNFLIFSLKNGNCNLSPSLQNERAHSPESNDNQIMVRYLLLDFAYTGMHFWGCDGMTWRNDGFWILWKQKLNQQYSNTILVFLLMSFDKNLLTIQMTGDVG